MIFVIVLAVVTFGFAIVAVYTDRTSESFWWGLLIGLMVGLLVDFLLLLALSMAPKEEWQLDHTNNIAILKDNHTYVVYRHDVDSTTTYDYMIDEGNSYVPASTSGCGVRIFNYSGRPHVEVFEKRKTNKWVQAQLDVLGNGYSAGTFYEFYVPAGTVVQEFSVDCE